MDERIAPPADDEHDGPAPVRERSRAPRRRFRGRLAQLAGLVTGLAAVACAGASDAGDVTGVRWRLVELEGEPTTGPEGEREAHILLDAVEGRVSGFTGCNRINGPFTLDGDRLRFGALATTRMACLEAALMEQEAGFLRALEATDRYAVEGERLTLYAGQTPVARFVAG